MDFGICSGKPVLPTLGICWTLPCATVLEWSKRVELNVRCKQDWFLGGMVRAKPEVKSAFHAHIFLIAGLINCAYDRSISFSNRAWDSTAMHSVSISIFFKKMLTSMFSASIKCKHYFERCVHGHPGKDGSEAIGGRVRKKALAPAKRTETSKNLQQQGGVTPPETLTAPHEEDF